MFYIPVCKKIISKCKGCKLYTIVSHNIHRVAKMAKCYSKKVSDSISSYIAGKRYFWPLAVIVNLSERIPAIPGP